LTLKFTSIVHEIHLHLRFNSDLNFIEVYATESWSILQGQNLAFLLQLPAGLRKITILVAQQKFIAKKAYLLYGDGQSV
jgi:hypothetical protein